MRSRLTAALAGALLILTALSTAAPVFAASTGTAVAQEQGGDKGQDDPGAETGADEEQSEPATPEEGPPWTYQMARISLLGLAALLLACAYMYWKLVVTRRRGER